MEQYKFLLEEKLTHLSLIILQDRVSSFIQELRGRDASAFPTYGCDLSWPSEEIIDVVLFGDASKTLAFAESWPRTPRFRIWVLCRAMKNFIEEAYGFNPGTIGVIPRYKLFPVNASPIPFPDIENEERTYIISSNYSQNKNVKLALGLLCRLQKNSSGDVQICGPRSETKLIQSLISEFSWNKVPTVLGNIGPDWAQHPFKNPVLVSLSTSLFEDFGVSVAQAQAAGFPLILSDWGAHKDVFGLNVVKIPSDIVGLHIAKPEELPERIAKSFDYLTHNSPSPLNTEIPELHPGRVFQREELIEYGKSYLKTYGMQFERVYGMSQYDPEIPLAKLVVKYFR